MYNSDKMIIYAGSLMTKFILLPFYSYFCRE